MRLFTTYPRARLKRRTVSGGRECTLRILDGRKRFVIKLLPTGRGSTTPSTALSSQPERSDGSRDGVLFRTVKMGVRSGWWASTSTSQSANERNNVSER